MGTPPVSTTVSGIPELVDHGTTGLLTEPRDAMATASAVSTLLADDDKRAAFGEQAREKVLREFDVATETRKLEASFKAARQGSHPDE